MGRSLRTPSEDAKIEFLQFDQPALESGKYTVEVEQLLESFEAAKKIGAQRYTKGLTFVVTGERFGPLAPQDIAAVFPPAGSVGEHANVLPHITLSRSTLPWERLPGTQDENLSWLALLLFRESDFTGGSVEKPRVKEMTLKELLSTPSTTARFPQGLEPEPGQQESDKVTVIDVQRKTLEPLLPTCVELAFLAHAHQRKDAGGAAESDIDATVVCNRLPEPGGGSTVHLISLEKRYKDGAFDFQGAGPDDWIRLVSLTSWGFQSVSPEHGFAALLHRLDREPGVLRAPLAVPPGSPAAPYIEQGHVALPHWMRRGSKSVSFYRGPFVPGPTADSVVLPVQCADQLVRYDPETGMFDATYAAAWELGRLITLANSRVALELFNWKREDAMQRNAMRQRAARRLPLRRLRSEAIAMPESVTDWFRDLSLLRGLPFSYLVPDERLLPAEGLRFFHVDPVWVDCLLDGAFSVGRVTEADVNHDRAVRARRSLREGPAQVSGFLMRSSVVSGWPDLLVEAYPTREDDASVIPPASAALPALRFDRLASDVLVVLFEGEVKTLDVFQAPEAMHYGLDAPDGDASEFTKNLRDPSGASQPETVPVPWSHAGKGVVDIAGLAERMKTALAPVRAERPFTAAQFALQMIEGVQRVRFLSSG